MPVIVTPDAYAEWLDPKNEATDRLARLLVPCDAPRLHAGPVSRRVNDARNQGPDLVQSLGNLGE
jgi:putative SOS response-associated peptidase YedK